MLNFLQPLVQGFIQLLLTLVQGIVTLGSLRVPLVRIIALVALCGLAFWAMSLLAGVIT